MQSLARVRDQSQKQLSGGLGIRAEAKASKQKEGKRWPYLLPPLPGAYIL